MRFHAEPPTKGDKASSDFPFPSSVGITCADQLKCKWLRGEKENLCPMEE